MAVRSQSTDLGPYLPLVPPLPRSSSFGPAPKSSKSSKRTASSSESTPLYPRIARVPERAIEGQERYGPVRSYGAVQELGDPTSQAYRIPVWQDQPIWSTGLFDCCADVPMCCFTIFLPCLAFGRNAESLDEGKNSCLTAAIVWTVLQLTTALGCLYSSGYRGKLRSKYSIPEGRVPDWAIHFLCWPCAFCQEYREIHFRTFGPESWGGRQTFMTVPPEQSFQSYHSR